MPGYPPCSRPSCEHPRALHAPPEGEYGACRVTRCECVAYLDPPSAEPEPEPEPRRLVIEIPDGFSVTVQLMPLEVLP